MMKRTLLTILSVLLLAGCMSSGYSTNPWNNTYAGDAQSAPKPLSSQTQEQPQQVQASADGTAVTQEQTAYGNNNYIPAGDAYNYGTAAAEQNTETAGYASNNYNTNDYSYRTGQPGRDTYGAYGTDQYGTRATSRPDSHMLAAPVMPPVKVALLVPLSGEHADIGQSMLQAAQLALFDMGYDSFELMPRDTMGTPNGARDAAQSAVNDGAQLILGPLFAASVRSAKTVTQRYNIKMIVFSTDWTLASANTYIMGFLPFAQVNRIAEYAAQNNLQRIGILAPNSNYGNAVVSSFQNASYRLGIPPVDVVKFPTDQNDISGIIRNFAKYDSRVESLNQQIRPLEARLKANPNDKQAQAELTALKQMESASSVPYDAVLLPVGGKQIRSVANLLSYYDMAPSQVRRLGTGIWDDPGLATEQALEGGWFAAPSPDLRRDFENRYRELYGNRPQRLASLAYDATALAAVLAKNGYQRGGMPSFDHASLTNPNGFAGIDGIFRFRPDGLVERGLAVLEIQDGDLKVISPAPTTFQRYGGL